MAFTRDVPSLVRTRMTLTRRLYGPVFFSDLAEDFLYSVELLMNNKDFVETDFRIIGIKLQVRWAPQDHPGYNVFE